MELSGITNADMIDTRGGHHSLDVVPGDLILLDGQPCTIELEQQEIRFFGNCCSVRCTAQALWYALAGERTCPTAQETGALIAEALQLSEQLRQWRIALEMINQQVAVLLEQELPLLPLPHARLDPFTEELLTRCPDQVSPEQLQTLVSLLGRSEHDIRAWLSDRGKSVMALTSVVPVPLPKQVETSTEEGEEAEREATTRRATFRWTSETIAQLKAAYRSQSDQTIDEQARSIAQRYGWPWRSVRYKLFQLRLTNARLKEESLALASGPFLWDVKVDGELKRWGLDYPYGHCPYQAGTICMYRKKPYRLEYVNNSQLTVTAVLAHPQPSEEPDYLEAEAREVSTGSLESLSALVVEV